MGSCRAASGAVVAVLNPRCLVLAPKVSVTTRGVGEAASAVRRGGGDAGGLSERTMHFRGASAPAPSHHCVAAASPGPAAPLHLIASAPSVICILTLL